jgi:hypothetical protein
VEIWRQFLKKQKSHVAGVDRRRTEWFYKKHAVTVETGNEQLSATQ